MLLQAAGLSRLDAPVGCCWRLGECAGHCGRASRPSHAILLTRPRFLVDGSRRHRRDRQSDRPGVRRLRTHRLAVARYFGQPGAAEQRLPALQPRRGGLVCTCRARASRVVSLRALILAGEPFDYQRGHLGAIHWRAVPDPDPFITAIISACSTRKVSSFSPSAISRRRSALTFTSGCTRC